MAGRLRAISRRSGSLREVSIQSWLPLSMLPLVGRKGTRCALSRIVARVGPLVGGVAQSCSVVCVGALRVGHAGEVSVGGRGWGAGRAMVLTEGGIGVEKEMSFSADRQLLSPIDADRSPANRASESEACPRIEGGDFPIGPATSALNSCASTRCPSRAVHATNHRPPLALSQPSPAHRTHTCLHGPLLHQILHSSLSEGNCLDRVRYQIRSAPS